MSDTAVLSSEQNGKQVNPMPRGILVFGANGSGKTTLGRELAQAMHCKHMDIEAYHFRPSAAPYTETRPRDECIRLMLADMQRYRTFVLSAVTGDFGEPIESLYGLAVYLSAPLAVRLARIRQRADRQYGERVCAGGDLYEQQRRFEAFVAARPLSGIEQWAETLTCPVMRVDGTQPVAETVRLVRCRWQAL